MPFYDEIDNEPKADVFFRYEWSPDDDEKYKDEIEKEAKKAEDILAFVAKNEQIPDDLIDDFCGSYEYLGWRNELDKNHKYYGTIGIALAAMGLQRQDSVLSVAAAYSIIRDLALNHYVDGLPALIVLICKQRLSPQLDAARRRENFHGNKEISPAQFWRNIAYYALYNYCKVCKIDINTLDVDNTANSDDKMHHMLYLDSTILYNVVHDKDARYGESEEEKLNNGMTWMLRRFFAALSETLDMAQIGQYDEEIYPDKIYSERDWERDNWERDY